MATTVYDAFIKNVISLPSDAPVTCTQIACNDEYIAFTALSNEICIFGVDEVEEKVRSIVFYYEFVSLPHMACEQGSFCP